MNDKLNTVSDSAAVLPELLEACERAYIGILNCESRVYMQLELCALRNALANTSGRTDRDIQDSYEAAAYNVRRGVAYTVAVKEARIPRPPFEY